MQTTIKVVIPMAGRGTRLRPHTWSKPKQLISVAGRTVLDHVLSTLSTLPGSRSIELVNIVGYLSVQIEEHLKKNYPEWTSQYVLQENPRGQSHAIQLARTHLQGPMLMVFADTIIETNLSFLEDDSIEAVAWVQEVSDPRLFGVAQMAENGRVKRLIEKPKELDNNLAVVGFYYFREAEKLLAAIDEQIQEDRQINGEYYLADAINILLERGLKMQVCKVEKWLDAGTPETLLETNRYLLEQGQAKLSGGRQFPDSVIVPPVFIHPAAEIQASIIGPHVSLGAGCHVENSILSDTILEDEARVCGVILDHSLVGRHTVIKRRTGTINAGDHTMVTL